MQKLPNEQKQKEIIREIERAEQKSREMAKFSQDLAEKWLSKRTQINSYLCKIKYDECALQFNYILASLVGCIDEV